MCPDKISASERIRKTLKSTVMEMRTQKRRRNTQRESPTATSQTAQPLIQKLNEKEQRTFVVKGSEEAVELVEAAVALLQLHSIFLAWNDWHLFFVR